MIANRTLDRANRTITNQRLPLVAIRTATNPEAAITVSSTAGCSLPDFWSAADRLLAALNAPYPRPAYRLSQAVSSDLTVFIDPR